MTYDLLGARPACRLLRGACTVAVDGAADAHLCTPRAPQYTLPPAPNVTVAGKLDAGSVVINTTASRSAVLDASGTSCEGPCGNYTWCGMGGGVHARLHLLQPHGPCSWVALLALCSPAVPCWAVRSLCHLPWPTCAVHSITCAGRSRARAAPPTPRPAPARCLCRRLAPAVTSTCLPPARPHVRAGFVSLTSFRGRLRAGAACMWCPGDVTRTGAAKVSTPQAPSRPTTPHKRVRRHITGNVSVTVMDGYGQTGTNSQPVALVIYAMPAPSAAIGPVITNTLGSVNVTAGGAAALTNDGSLCPSGNCTTLWSLACPQNRGFFANRTGANISVTTGGNGSHDVNTAGLWVNETISCEQCARKRGRASRMPRTCTRHAPTAEVSLGSSHQHAQPARVCAASHPQPSTPTTCRQCHASGGGLLWPGVDGRHHPCGAPHTSCPQLQRSGAEPIHPDVAPHRADVCGEKGG